jgi:gluconolactonase
LTRARRAAAGAGRAATRAAPGDASRRAAVALAAVGVALAGAALAACRAGRGGERAAGAAGAAGGYPAVGRVDRLDPALDRLVPPDARIEQLAQGFAWSEGPVWRRDDAGGHLLFSDVPGNTIYRWDERRGLGVFLRPSGFAGPGDPPGRELGTNGLTLDASGALVVADHGNRQVARLDERTFTKVPLADRFEGRRLNSPNDLAFGANGDLYFTDPPYGLAGQDRDPAKELAFNGVYRRTAAGALSLVTRELSRPNGLALSPDGRTLYVANSDAARGVWVAYAVGADGAVAGAPDARGRVVFDATALARRGLPGSPTGCASRTTAPCSRPGPAECWCSRPRGGTWGRSSPAAPWRTARSGAPTAGRCT